MKVKLISIPVRDQEKALRFYTDVLGFLKNKDTPLGGGNRWLTLVSDADKECPEILLAPAALHFEPSKIYQEALYEAGIPCTQFDVDSVESEFSRLISKGVEFSVNPTVMDTVKFAVFNDTCGNHIQIVEYLE
jgi:catechol 2,3-dioxygenase-like lactoylglutathione lyase family enzyme